MNDYAPLHRIMKPKFVIQMNWHRWKRSTRIKWLHILRDACIETAEDCDKMIERMESEYV